MLLEIDGVTKNFAGLVALREVGFGVAAGSITGLIGPNGAGKTTLFNVVTGVLAASAGRIRFDGADVTGLALERRIARGLARTFQHPRVFRSLTAWENVMLGCRHRARAGFLAHGLRLAAARREQAGERAAALDWLEQVGLAEVRDRPAQDLPLGQQRHLELARALAAEPRLLLLDEPAAGLNEREIAELQGLILRLRDRGITVLVIEHHMRFVMASCDAVAVLNFGRLIAFGPPRAVQGDPRVVEAYLGAPADA